MLKNITIENIDISKLNLLEKNPRKITKDQMEKLCKSIQNDPDFLFNRPILVHEKDSKLNVYAGNQRVRAAKKLNWKQIPCIIDKNLSDEVIKARIIKDNKTYGEFDFDILANEWDIDLLLDAGFNPEELMGAEIKDLGSTEENNEVLEPIKDEDAITKLGDIYELNNHILICGDSTNPDHVKSILDKHQPILMITDPPYGVEYDPSWRKNIKKNKLEVVKALGKVQNDDRVNWSLAWHFFPGSIAYIWHAGKYCSEVQKSLEEAEFEIISQIIWAKQHFALSRGDYHWQHEPCWYAVKKGHQHNWQGARDQSTIWEISNLNAFGGKKEDGEERTAHSTQKPMECMAKPIKNNSQENDYIYDPFIGSGTTLIAAEQLNRKCIGVELSPAYCDLVVDRWKNWMIKNGKSFIIKLNGNNLD